VPAARIRIDTVEDLASGVRALIEIDGRFATVCEAAGELELRRRAPGFEALAWIMSGQMISLRAAEAIWGRTRAALGEVTAERVLGADEGVLRAAGQSWAKVAAIRAAAEAVTRGELDFARIGAGTDEAGAAELMRVRGIGGWTAAMYLLACEGRPDVWPVGDVALRAAAGAAFGLGRRAEEAELVELGRAWRPWRAVAARVLWAYYRAMR
jgi:DNA-3-methyladenine glycosylase II